MSFKENPFLFIGISLIGFIILFTLITPLFYKVSPFEIDLENRLLPPSKKYPLGKDELGRDELARILYGARISLLVGFTVVFISAVVGLIMGLISGFAGGLIDEVIMRLVDILLAFPGILLAIALIAFFGPSLVNLIFALVLTGWVGYSRLARAQVLKLKEMDFITAAKAIGAGYLRILFRHLMPNVLPFILVQASLGIAGAILAESGLSFLGLGVQPPTPSWGAMINQGRNHLFDAPWLTIFPGIALLITILGFNLLGEGLRKIYTPKEWE
ncbi:ABC transporter permease [SCandidatus Aminicenantes bacterium Aminicenantia_JdfR_composite]|jgi:peptide/nickel transport system permease protein|nr:ABC transporter permease [SCandidatus Aminicenantes bacterium Aminicenantia_JdfR_composite]MCP2597583.1 ABC transporter permease [Candidatus Aminicenantes bacterium AC-335-G13]MCP2597735.1 ABC transporter permease [Candidatus Aminicenantes bacterium AC-335-L06]MCP2620902.1 ABC transporter permease [Candidatus Aminicenantes bacterium AC-334-E05]